jgi:glycosyltransferase involved in cell wall biosynthesis
VKEPPVCSIVVPTHSRPEQLSACLEALAALDYPRERFEVIVVDDGSEPPLAGLAARFEGRLRLTLLRQACSGPAASRNAGAAIARGQILAFTDDDCRPERGWLRAVASHVEAFLDDMIGGRTINALPDVACSAASQAIIDAVYTYYNADPRKARFFASNNIAMSAERFRAIGGFDPSFRTSEDRDLCDRWLRAGGGMTYLPEALVLHAHYLTLGAFLRQHFHYGRGAFRFLQARIGRGDSEFNHPPDFYRRLIALPLAEPSRRRALYGAVLLVASQGASIMGFALERVRARSDRARPERPPAVVVERTSDVPVDTLAAAPGLWR